MNAGSMTKVVSLFSALFLILSNYFAIVPSIFFRRADLFMPDDLRL